MGVLLIVVVLAVVAASVWFSAVRTRRRRSALASFAAAYGLRYSPEDPFGLVDYDFHLLDLGDGRGCENVVSGVWQGLPVKEADYWYYDRSRDAQGHTSKTYHRFSIVLADLEAIVPEVSIQKEGMLSTLAGHLGFHDLEFESEDFNREFRVSAGDREFAYKLVDARMMRWLLSTSGEFGFETNGSNLLVWCHRRRPTDLVPLVGTAKAFSDHVPNLVWSEYGTRAAEPAEAKPEGGNAS